MELLGGLVVLEDGATVGADEVVGTCDDRVKDDIDVERTAPRAVSSPTERVRSSVRACSSVNSRTFSIAMTA